MAAPHQTYDATSNADTTAALGTHVAGTGQHHVAAARDPAGAHHAPNADADAYRQMKAADRMDKADTRAAQAHGAIDTAADKVKEGVHKMTDMFKGHQAKKATNADHHDAYSYGGPTTTNTHTHTTHKY